MDRRRTLALVLAVGASGAIGAAALPAPAAAASFTVDTTADTPDPNPGDGTCGSGAGTCSLRAAIQETNRSTMSNSITLPPGKYVLTVSGPDEAWAATGDLDIVGTLTLSGASSDQTIIDGGGIDRVFDVGENAVVEISDVTIRGGTVNGGNGGGILNDGRLKLSNVALAGNRAKADPQNQNGAGAAIASHTHLSAMNLRVSGNTADGNGGGIDNTGFLELTNGSVTGNASLTQNGGGISNDGKLTLLLSTIEGNRATNGGGLDNVDGEVRIVDSTIAGNSTSAAGGGIRSSGPLTIVNSTLSGNTASAAGGGIANVGKGTVDLNNVTIASNAAGSAGGGGLAGATTGTMTMGNTIVAGNAATGGKGPDCAAAVVSRGWNLVQNAEGCMLTGSPGGDQTAKDPKLAALAANDGPTRTRALLPGSPAIDAGNPADPTGEGGACAPADQRGVKRPQNGSGGAGPVCDIGAYELEPAKKTSSLGRASGTAAGG
jgi:CSLREA domain-containing protein